jgi:hypothetical protein
LFIKGCFMTSIKVGLSLGFFFNSRWIKSLASADKVTGNYNRLFVLKIFELLKYK